MTTERDVYELDTSDAVEGLDNLEQSLGKTGKQAESLSELFQEDLKQSFFTAQAAYDGLKTVVHATVETLKESVAAAIDAEMQDRKLATAIKNAGYDVGRYTEMLSGQASAMERLLGKDDEYFKQLQTLAITFGVMPDQVDRFTKAALDLAAATGQDATMALRLLARANAEGKDELAKFGISVDESAFKARGFAAVLDEVERKFGGLAADMPEQVKAVNELRGAWESLKEAIGGAILQAGSFSKISSLLVQAMDGWSEILSGKTTDALTTYQESTIKAEELTNSYNAQVAEGKKRLTEYNEAVKSGAFNVDYYKQRLDEIKGVIKNTAEEQNKLNTLTHLDSDPLTNRVRVSPINLEGGDERAKKLKQWDAEYKAHLQENEKLFVMSKSNLLKAEKEHDAEMATQQRESVLNAGSWEEAQLEEYKAIKAAEYEVNRSAAEQEEALRQQRADQEKAFYDNLENELMNYGRRVLDFLGNMLEEQLTQNAEYNEAYKSALIERRVYDSELAGAKKTHAEVEKELQQEERAAQEKKTAAFLASIAKEAGIKALMEGVDAIASLAKYDYAAAAQHGIAAAAYGGVALAAGGSAAAISASRGMTADEKASIESLNRRDKDREERAAKTTGPSDSANVQQNVYYFGISGMNDLQQASELERLRRQYDRLATGA